jgi:hypothetical protein
MNLRILALAKTIENILISRSFSDIENQPNVSKIPIRLL